MPNQLKEKRVVDWPNIRLAFVQESPRPTYAELSARFATPQSTISNCSNDEGWPIMRAEFLEQKLRESGAAEIVLKAVNGEGKIIQQARQVLADFLAAIGVMVEELAAEKKALSTRANTANVISFALVNAGRFSDSMGLLGMPTDLRKARREGESAGWGKDMLQQINITVGELQSQAKAAHDPAAVVEQSAPMPGAAAPDAEE